MATRLIAHRIFKDQHDKTTRLLLRESLIEVTETAEALLKELRSALTKSSQGGKFSRPAGVQPPFEIRLSQYIEIDTDAEFIAFSSHAANLLEKQMSKELLATGGYIVFAEYETGEEVYNMVALLSTREHATFDDDLNLVSTPTLDFDHLRHGARVRRSGLATNMAGVVQFVSKAEGVSDYFREFLGCEEIEDTSAQGRQLHAVLTEVADAHKLDIEEINLIAYAYWERCQKEKLAMTLAGLANQIAPNDPDPILQSLSADKHGLPGEFRPPPKRVMLQFVKFAFNDSGLRFEFDRKTWADKIKISGKSVQIREAPAELISKIKEELDLNDT